jgi:hypothetical protein
LSCRVEKRKSPACRLEACTSTRLSCDDDVTHVFAATPDRTQLPNTKHLPLHILPSTRFLAIRTTLRRTQYHENWTELAIDKSCQECVPDYRLAKDASVSPTNPCGHSCCDTFNIAFTAAGVAHEASPLDNMRNTSSDDRRDRSRAGLQSLLRLP